MSHLFVPQTRKFLHEPLIREAFGFRDRLTPWLLAFALGPLFPFEYLAIIITLEPLRKAELELSIELFHPC